MGINEVLKTINNLPSREDGGNIAQDGFCFQKANAIFVMFGNIRDEKKFGLLYEKHDDFIIVSEEIEIYQAKKLSSNLSKSILMSEKKRSGNIIENSSILGKMIINHNLIKKNFDDRDCVSFVVINKERNFSSRHFNESENADQLSLLYLKDNIKTEICDTFGIDESMLNSFIACRLLYFNESDRFVKGFITEVVTSRYGPNKLDVTALYDSLVILIDNIRRNQGVLISDDLEKNITKFAKFNVDMEIGKIIHFLSDEDKRNMHITRSFSIYSSEYNLEFSPRRKLIDSIINLIKENSFVGIYEIYDYTKGYLSPEEKLLYSREEIIALICVAVYKEGNY